MSENQENQEAKQKKAPKTQTAHTRDEQLSDIREALVRLAATHDALISCAEKQSYEIEELKKLQSQHRTETDQRLQQIDAGADASLTITRKMLSEHKTLIEQIEKSIENIHTWLGQAIHEVKSALNDHDHRLHVCDGKLSSLKENDIQAILSDIACFNDRLITIDKGLTLQINNVRNSSDELLSMNEKREKSIKFIKQKMKDFSESIAHLENWRSDLDKCLTRLEVAKSEEPEEQSGAHDAPRAVEAKRNESTPLVEDARAFLFHVADMLDHKNKAYGNSALDPVRMFSQSDRVEQIRVRIDDKLSRIIRGSDMGEDTIADLAGYLALLHAATKEETP